jgi:hypothetical protein
MAPYLAAAIAFAMVMAGMIVLTAVCYLLRGLGRRPPRRGAQEGGIDEELAVVLAAAASEALGRAVSIHHIHVHREPTVERWSRAGRLDVMISHRVERRR